MDAVITQIKYLVSTCFFIIQHNSIQHQLNSRGMLVFQVNLSGILKIESECMYSKKKQLIVLLHQNLHA